MEETINKKHSQEEAEKIRTSQFVCFEIIEFPVINLEYKQENAKSQYKSYQNVKFFFHSWYKKNSRRTFILASNEFSLKTGELYKFICDWHGEKIPEYRLRELTVENLKALAVGLNAVIEYKTGAGPTKILNIKPSRTEKLINLLKGLEIPEFLINRPFKQNIGKGFGILKQGGNNDQ